MEFRRTTAFSFVLHMLIIAMLFALNGRETVYRIPARSTMALEFREMSGQRTLPSQNIPAVRSIGGKAADETAFRKTSYDNSAAQPATSTPDEPDESTNNKADNLSVLNRDTTIRGEITGAAVPTPHRSEGTSIQMTEAAPQNDHQSVYQLIRAAIERAKTYPLFAQEKKVQGTVFTAFTINPAGYPVNITIEKSSGHRILDAAAVHTIKRAAPFPQTDKRIEIPITFKLAGSSFPH